MTTFRSADPKQSFPSLEEEILAFWQKQRIFERSVEQGIRENRPWFVFFEGPPTANGKPGIHHVLTRAFKDVIPRYKTMRGYYVPRKAGWDCHGLPVEVEVEKRLGLTGKKQIEAYGVKKFNEQCRESVLRYIHDWDRLTERVGFWLDTKHAYKTLDNSYIESCWSLLKELWNKDLLKQDYKITKHCPRCGTSLAEAEANQGMKEHVEDPAVTVKLVLHPGQRLPFGSHTTDEAETSLLVWTTTPWTLPANVAAALHENADYVLCERMDKASGASTNLQERFILLASQAERVLGKVKILGTASGKGLAGLRYQALYSSAHLSGVLATQEESAHAFQTILDPSVSADEGTGIVHIAPAYGDLEVGRKHNLPIFFSVGLDGIFLPTWERFAGKFFKEADPLIIRDLKERSLLVKNERTHHSYPFCWRCDTPLLYFAKTSWYIKTTAKKEEMLTANEQIHWFPSHIKEGRFGDWLRNNVDWAISRERYWGTPLPLWKCSSSSCDETLFIGSISDLSEQLGRNIDTDPHFDLHRPYVDELSWPCAKAKCDGTMGRVKEVIDCWFDSGAMPYAQHHYPFENKEIFKKSFPADFICEAVDQTRGWFYTLHALSVLTQGGPAYKNCIVLGHILDEQGRKMAKRLGNIVDPWTVLNAEGADALRYYLYTASPPGQPRRFSQNLVRQGLRQFMLTLWNCYGFFVTYAEAEYHLLGKEMISWEARPVMDQWILGKLHRLVASVTQDLDSYDITNSLRRMNEFIDELSNWYVRRNRDRFWSSLEGPQGKVEGELERSKRAAYQSLYECLRTLSQLLAPFLPFISEYIWQNLVRALDRNAVESVHLASWPKADEGLMGETTRLVKEMEAVLKVVNLGRAARVEQAIKIRQPLRAVKIQAVTKDARETLSRFEKEIKEELNVEELEWVSPHQPLVEYTLRPNLPVLGKKYGPLLKHITQAFQTTSLEKTYDWAQSVLAQRPIELTLPQGSIELTPEEVLLSTQSAPGFAAQADSGWVVALSTEITPELREKGIIREMIRTLGDLRKQVGCKVTDKVKVGFFSTDELLISIVTKYASVVQSETLCTLIHRPLELAQAKADLELDESVLELTLSKIEP